MVGSTTESMYITLWLVFFRIEILTTAMLSWLIGNVVYNACVLGIMACACSYLDVKRRHDKQ